MTAKPDITAETPVIETDGLTRRFGDLVAVDDVSMTVESGEVFGFLGPNGAGKSTTINILLGFLNLTEGNARVFGHDVTADSVRIRRRLGLLPEGFRALENLSAREHITSAIQCKDASDDPDEIIERVGLDAADARRPVGNYSTGMKQRLALGLALIGKPDLLILDEPSSGLDPTGVIQLRDIVREEANRGATVFFSSHVLDEVEKVCDRVGILNQGTLVAVNSVDTLRDELGATAVLEVTVNEVPQSGSLMDLDGVADVSVDGRTFRISCDRPGAKMAVLRWLDERVAVTDFRTEEVSLEAVFETVTSDDEETETDVPRAAMQQPNSDSSEAGGS